MNTNANDTTTETVAETATTVPAPAKSSKLKTVGKWLGITAGVAALGAGAYLGFRHFKQQ